MSVEPRSEPTSTSDDDARLTAAEGLLREAVYRSRASQAAASALGLADPADTSGRCGLGERAAVVLDLTPEGRRHFDALWPVEPDAATLERVREAIRAWVVEADARDRKRNHFLKAFRAQNGFDRTRYTPAQTHEFESGLERLNADENTARRAAARRVLGTDSGGG